MSKIHACGDPTGEFSGNGLKDPNLPQLMWNNVSHTMPEDEACSPTTPDQMYQKLPQSWCSGLKQELFGLSKEKGTIKGPTFQRSLSLQVAGFYSASGHGFALGNCSIMQKAVKKSWRCREWAFLLPCLAGVSGPKACLKKYFAQATCNGLVKQAFIIDSLHHATHSPSRWKNHFPSLLMLLSYAVVRNWLIATFGQSRESEQ